MFRVSVEAQNDLAEIARYTERTWGRDQRNKYLAKIEDTFERINKHPSIGQACDEVRAGYSCFLVEKHLIFYRVDDGGVEIVRVLHKSMQVVSKLPSKAR